MRKLKSNIKLITLFFTSFLLIDTKIIFLDQLRAEEGNDFQNKKSSIYFEDKFPNNKTKYLQKFLYDDFLNFGNNIIYFLSLKKDPEKNDFSLEIESDIQYEKDNIYFAEGNAVIYFSNAILRGDKIIYDKTEKTLTVLGRVTFLKGNQYFEASKVFYNLKKNKGFIDNIYGILDVNSSIVDFEFKNITRKDENENSNKISDLQYIDTVSFGLVNDFEKDRKFNIKQFRFDIPSIKKWRYKSKKIILENDILKSNEILFTNDALNKPQFILKSKNFTGEVVDEKIKLVSKNSWIILDDIFSVPIGSRSIYDKDPVSSWGIGADYKEKDGFYFSRNFKEKNLNKDFKLKLRPYFLFQRALKGETNAFRAKDSSILSQKVNNDALISDYFGLDAKLGGVINKWNFIWDNRLNSLNPNRFSEAIRTKISLYKSIDLNKDKDLEINSDLYFEGKNDRERQSFVNIQRDDILDIQDIKKSNLKEVYKNNLDLKFTSSYREKISRGFSGESEIYFGNSLSIANKKSWNKGGRFKELSFISDIGKFKAKSKNENRLEDLYRSVLASSYRSINPLWKKDLLDKNINENYRYTNVLIKEGIDWDTNILTAIFLYSDGSTQKNLSFSAGPTIILGKLKNNIFDYSSINIKGNYILKSGESPFLFDNIDEALNVNFQLKQQILGPIIFSYSRSYNIDEGTYSKPIYGIDISRRAYKIGAFYNESSKSVGFQFNVFNFNYSGKSPKF